MIKVTYFSACLKILYRVVCITEQQMALRFFLFPQQASSNFASFTIWREVAQNEAGVPLLLFSAGQQFGSAQDKSKSFTSGFWAGVERCTATESQSESSNDQYAGANFWNQFGNGWDVHIGHPQVVGLMCRYRSKASS